VAAGGDRNMLAAVERLVTTPAHPTSPTLWLSAASPPGSAPDGRAHASLSVDGA
jgi:hypothetical protein